MVSLLAVRVLLIKLAFCPYVTGVYKKGDNNPEARASASSLCQCLAKQGIEPTISLTDKKSLRCLGYKIQQLEGLSTSQLAVTCTGLGERRAVKESDVILFLRKKKNTQIAKCDTNDKKTYKFVFTNTADQQPEPDRV